MLKEYLQSNLVFKNLECESFKDVLATVSEKLVKLDFAGEEFEEALLIREKDYPTGLQLEGYTAAIPHGGAEFVKKDFISVVTLKKPIVMSRMDNPEKTLTVDTLFILGFGSSDLHLTALRQLMETIQNKETMEQIKAGKELKALI